MEDFETRKSVDHEIRPILETEQSQFFYGVKKEIRKNEWEQ